MNWSALTKGDIHLIQFPELPLNDDTRIQKLELNFNWMPCGIPITIFPERVGHSGACESRTPRADMAALIFWDMNPILNWFSKEYYSSVR
ncbi:hypothetical protein CEXT_221181 [Caerostris extrusa]|uniref:Uncharacterized protein n=1 Tax=Caerostris extrusa TaxID=172846 RepID=A0AAV4PYW6_CAEEX|nr:hypothetical protein CEXT_221181 [Caerostris extrusa]